MDGSTGSLPSPVTASDSHLSVPADVETRPRAFNGVSLASRHGWPHLARKLVAPGDDEHPGPPFVRCIRTTVAGTHLPSPGPRKACTPGLMGYLARQRVTTRVLVRSCLPRTRRRAGLQRRLTLGGQCSSDLYVSALPLGAIAVKDNTMSRARRAHPHNSRKQRCFQGINAPQNPILAWIASDLPRGPQMYLRELQRQSALLRTTLYDAGTGKSGDELLAAVLLRAFAASHGLTTSEALCLMPHAAQTAGEAVYQLRLWSSAIPAR